MRATSTVKASEYDKVTIQETADGVTGELIIATINHAPIGEAQKVIARSIMASILFNSTSTALSGGRVTEVIKEYVTDPSNMPKFAFRHVIIPAITHGLVHCAAQLSCSVAAQATDLEAQMLPTCTSAIGDGLCQLALQIADVIPDVPL